ncbi:MAG: ATP-binding protein [Dehalococcoidia bacterium]|nr:ATP-binding protein [Dehalococcoidia bacterium]
MTAPSDDERPPAAEEAGIAHQLTLGLQSVLYDARFMDAHVGRTLLSDPIAALVELVANAWDAGATRVRIAWPIQDNGTIAVQDNGTGMTDEEFQRRWRTMNYNRRADQGDVVRFPPDASITYQNRPAFGRNGIGRWAAFCFDASYIVDTTSTGLRNRYRIARGTSEPFEITQQLDDEPATGHGTEIRVTAGQHAMLPPSMIRAQLGMRFLTDPDFAVLVNDEVVNFEDIDGQNLEFLTLDVGDGHSVELIIIDTHITDRTSQQKGIAWHVDGRLVGKCSWDGPRAEAIIDRRRIAARRFTFIVRADHLSEAEAIKQDWSGFDEDNEAYRRTADIVYDAVDRHLLSVSEADRERTLGEAQAHNSAALREMTPLNRERWLSFVNEAQEKCPRIREDDILKLSEIVANLELSTSGYSLLHKLSEYGPDQLDDLYGVLEDWTLDMVKIVLDEIATRLKLIDELEARANDDTTREVQHLQPLFKKGLWIFGPEFETIEYTSNAGMSRVIQELFGVQETGSKNRPDFVVLPDSTAGLYAYPSYDKDGGENGIDRMVVIELKKPGIRLGEEEKTQCWKYVRELFRRGMLQQGRTRVTCFVLGSEMESIESDSRSEMQGTVEIVPMLFVTVLQRAKSRMLKLHERVKGAPLLEAHRQEIERFLAPVSGEPTLFDVAPAG